MVLAPGGRGGGSLSVSFFFSFDLRPFFSIQIKYGCLTYRLPRTIRRRIIFHWLFHVFSDEDRKRYVAGLATVLKPGGHLFLLCFSNEELGTQGPRRISQKELHDTFAEGWAIESVRPSRSKSSPTSKSLRSPRVDRRRGSL